MSAEIFEVETQYDVSRSPSDPVKKPPKVYVNVRGGTERQHPDGRSGTADAPRGRVFNDDAAPHDERAPQIAFIGSGLPKILEICIASSIHTMVWIVLLWWIDLFNASHIFGGQSLVDTVFAFVFIWVSTFACFYALVEEDD